MKFVTTSPQVRPRDRFIAKLREMDSAELVETHRKYSAQVSGIRSSHPNYDAIVDSLGLVQTELINRLEGKSES